MTDFSDPITLASIILAIGTLALLGITTYYAVETKRIRRSSELPSFSLESSLTTLSGQVLHMDLINSGASVTDVRIDFSWSGGSKKIYAISLSTHGHNSLNDIPYMKLEQDGGTFALDIHCKDVRGEQYTTPTLTMDFGIAKRENRELSYNQVLWNQLCIV